MTNEEMYEKTFGMKVPEILKDGCMCGMEGCPHMELDCKDCKFDGFYFWKKEYEPQSGFIPYMKMVEIVSVSFGEYLETVDGYKDFVPRTEVIEMLLDVNKAIRMRMKKYKEGEEK